MRAMMIVGIVAALATRASAGIVIAPPGWLVDDERADSIRATAAAIKHFGGVTAYTTSAVYVAPTPGVVLYATNSSLLISADSTMVAIRPQDREAAARAEVDDLRETTRRAALVGSNLHEDEWHERVDPGTNLIEARLTWRDDDAHTIAISRRVIAADGSFMAIATADCVATPDHRYPRETPTLAACRAALETLDPGIKPAKRVVLGLAASGIEPTPTPTPTTQPAKLDDGSRVVLPPTAIPQRPAVPDRRPVYVGGGLVVLAAVFWWNRRRRERFEREDEESP
jgi:hypothetical protein